MKRIIIRLLSWLIDGPMREVPLCASCQAIDCSQCPERETKTRIAIGWARERQVPANMLPSAKKRPLKDWL